MKINGINASDGIAIGKVYKLETVSFVIPSHPLTNKEDELLVLERALKKAEQELKIIKEKTRISIDQEHADIFDAHIQIVNDPEILSQVTSLMVNENQNVTFAYNNVCDTFAQIFESMDNEYMKERAADVKDIKKRVLFHLLGIEMNDPSLIDEEVIIVASDLTPSDTAQLNKNFVLGFATNIGGKTSHSAIMARTLEIPAVVGTQNIMSIVNNDDEVIINGALGYVIISPTKEEVDSHRTMQEEFVNQKKIWKKYSKKSTKTKDLHHVELAANIGSPEDIESVLKTGAEGIGLYRTEFLYMNNDNLPTEEEQFIAYKIVLEKMQNKKVVIRTLDIGGDKQLDYLPLDHELNPFLGQRALRLCLENIDLFKTQLRALVRASKYGDLHIMFPMVATINELRQAKAVLEESKQELINEGKEVGTYKVGIMVEIPSVAILADQFAKEVDFFSIGTNDLIQYSFAADRMNQKVSYLYQPLNPSLLRLIKMVIDASHKEGIWTGMCGEMAGDQLAAPILLGLGLDEFSMSASSVLQTRYSFDHLNKKDMEVLSSKALQCATSEEVEELVKNSIL